jgi:hypothetical protein
MNVLRSRKPSGLSHRLRLILGIPLASAIAFGVLGFSPGLPGSVAGAAAPTFNCVSSVYYYNTTISIAVGSAYIDYQECVAWNGTYESWSLKITGMPSWAYSGGPNEFEIFGNLSINGKDISGASTPWTTSLNQFVSGKIAYWVPGKYCESIWIYSWWGNPAHWFKANLQPGFSACMTL